MSETVNNVEHNDRWLFPFYIYLQNKFNLVLYLTNKQYEWEGKNYHLVTIFYTRSNNITSSFSRPLINIKWSNLSFRHWQESDDSDVRLVVLCGTRIKFYVSILCIYPARQCLFPWHIHIYYSSFTIHWTRT